MIDDSQKTKRERLKMYTKLLLVSIILVTMFFIEFQILVFTLDKMQIKNATWAAFFLLYFIFPLFKSKCISAGMKYVKS